MSARRINYAPPMSLYLHHQCSCTHSPPSATWTFCIERKKSFFWHRMFSGSTHTQQMHQLNPSEWFFLPPAQWIYSFFSLSARFFFSPPSLVTCWQPISVRIISDIDLRSHSNWLLLVLLLLDGQQYVTQLANLVQFVRLFVCLFLADIELNLVLEQKKTETSRRTQGELWRFLCVSAFCCCR